MLIRNVLPRFPERTREKAAQRGATQSWCCARAECFDRWVLLSRSPFPCSAPVSCPSVCTAKSRIGGAEAREGREGRGEAKSTARTSRTSLRIPQLRQRHLLVSAPGAALTGRLHADRPAQARRGEAKQPACVRPLIPRRAWSQLPQIASQRTSIQVAPREIQAQRSISHLALRALFSQGCR